MIENLSKEDEPAVTPIQKKFPKRVGESVVFNALAIPDAFFEGTDFTPQPRWSQDNLGQKENWHAVIRGHRELAEGYGTFYSIAFTPESLFKRAIRRIRYGQNHERHFVVRATDGYVTDRRLPSFSDISG